MYTFPAGDEIFALELRENLLELVQQIEEIVGILVGDVKSPDFLANIFSGQVDLECNYIVGDSHFCCWMLGNTKMHQVAKFFSRLFAETIIFKNATIIHTLFIGWRTLGLIDFCELSNCQLCSATNEGMMSKQRRMLFLYWAMTPSLLWLAKYGKCARTKVNQVRVFRLHESAFELLFILNKKNLSLSDKFKGALISENIYLAIHFLMFCFWVHLFRINCCIFKFRIFNWTTPYWKWKAGFEYSGVQWLTTHITCVLTNNILRLLHHVNV